MPDQLVPIAEVYVQRNLDPDYPWGKCVELPVGTKMPRGYPIDWVYVGRKYGFSTGEEVEL